MEMAVTAAGSLPSYANGHEPVYDREAGEEEGSTMIEMGSPRGSADGHPLEPNAMRIETSLHEGTNERVNEMSGADIAKYFAGIVAVFILFTVIGSASGPPRLLTSRTYNEVTTDVLSKRPVFLSGIHFNSDLPQFFFMEMSFENKKNARMKVEKHNPDVARVVLVNHPRADIDVALPCQPRAWRNAAVGALRYADRLLARNRRVRTRERRTRGRRGFVAHTKSVLTMALPRAGTTVS